MTPGTGPGTFPAALAARLRADPAQPLVTFYDDATGERVELSVTTYANWVAKTAGLIQDELELARGERVYLALPPHWLGAVWLGAAWAVGLSVGADGQAFEEGAEVYVCGPDGLDRCADRAGGGTVMALSLRPMGGPFTDPLPTGVVDYGAVVLGQPDAFLPFDPARPEDPAWRDGTGSWTQQELLAEGVTAGIVGSGGRLLTDVNPGSRPGAMALASVVVAGASLVLVGNPDESLWKQRYDDERATAELRG